MLPFELIDWGRYRVAFEQEMSRAIKQEVKIDGNIRLRTFPGLYIRIERLRLATPGPQSDPRLSAASVNALVASRRLIFGSLEVIEAKIDGLRLRIAPDERSNARTVMISVLRVVKGQLQLTDAKFIFESGANQSTEVLTLDGWVRFDNVQRLHLFTGIWSTPRGRRDVSDEPVAGLIWGSLSTGKALEPL